MDGPTFDTLARRWAGATARSRRTLLGGLVAGAAGLLGARRTAAQNGCGADQVNRRGRGCVCRAAAARPRRTAVPAHQG